MSLQQLVFATNNEHKLEEVRRMLGARYQLLGLKDIGCNEDIPETGQSFHENAAIKSRYVTEHFGLNCFADDSGLECDGLEGAPGIYSARYAGPNGDSAANMAKLLRELEGNSNRAARFRTVIALRIDGREYFFEGRIEGLIRSRQSGTAGFGYDPLFQPKGYDITFAEMTPEEKNRISHRGQAIQQLIEFLRA